MTEKFDGKSYNVIKLQDKSFLLYGEGAVLIALNVIENVVTAYFER